MVLNAVMPSYQIRGIDGTGGLGDVPVGLVKSFTGRTDIKLRLIMPGFENPISGDDPMLKKRFDKKNLVCEGVEVPYKNGIEKIDVYQIFLPGTEGSSKIVCYLLRCQNVFGTGKRNTPRQAILFARATVEFLKVYRDFRVDLIHCNDWHTGLIPVYLRTLYGKDQYLSRIATLFTAHNATGDAYQGVFPSSTESMSVNEILQAAHLSKEQFQIGITESLNHDWKFNFSKGGLGFADLINTVSLQYRQELLTPSFSNGLDGLFNERNLDFVGIINGIDIEEWDPETDKNLGDHQYSERDKHSEIMAGKKRIRMDYLQEWTCQNENHPMFGEQPFKYLDPNKVLIGTVSRLDYQKAPILLEAIRQLVTDNSGIWDNVQIAILGSANDDWSKSHYENPLLELSKKYPEKILFYNGFNIPLSHIIYASSEIFMVPSVFVPCGLTQLVAMRYGAVPIVRAVGGLYDTVIDNHRAPQTATGFTFMEAHAADQMFDQQQAAVLFLDALKSSLTTFQDEERWKTLVSNGMKTDSSWDIPGMLYRKVYDEALRRSFQNSFYNQKNYSLTH